MISLTRTSEAPVVSRYAATHVALGDDTHQFQVFRMLNYGCAAQSGNRVSLSPRLLPCLAAYSRKTLQLVSSTSLQQLIPSPLSILDRNSVNDEQIGAILA